MDNESNKNNMQITDDIYFHKLVKKNKHLSKILL
jgi:hypothetical protein